ncbi:MAG TPA: deoxynucleoside kinase [Candidatus Goldiibacteriota bacterium]|nr:deoxynucleoside kinase [Candidatus Goldiibacteriota bacterium]
MTVFHYISIEGVLGAGKTSFAKLLSQDLSARLVLEDVDNNPFLEKFYKDMKIFALQTQLFFLFNRVGQLEALKQLDLFQKTIVSDYLIEKDRIFAYITLDENELAIYEKIYNILVNEKNLIKPDLVIFLQASVDVLMERIKKRGRDFEKNISKDYIFNLSQAYNHFFSHYNASPLVIINTDDIDFINDKKIYNSIKNFSLNVKGGVHYFMPSKG